MPTHQDRYKSVVIPVLKNKYIVVEDKTYKELTFVVGGCKLREIGGSMLTKNRFEKDYSVFKKCALRELEEETRGALGNIHPLQLRPAFKFSSRDRSHAELKKDFKENVIVTMRYTVFYLFLDDQDFSVIQRRFNRGPKNTRNQRETKAILLVSKSELVNNTKGKMWRFMKEYVLPRIK